MFDKKDLSHLDTVEFLLFVENHERGDYPSFMVEYFDSLTVEEQKHYFIAYQTVRNQLREEKDLVDNLWSFLQTNTVDTTFEREFLLYVLFFGPNLDVREIYPPNVLQPLLNKYNQEISEILDEANNAFTSVSLDAEIEVDDPRF